MGISKYRRGPPPAELGIPLIPFMAVIIHLFMWIIVALVLALMGLGDETAGMMSGIAVAIFTVPLALFGLILTFLRYLNKTSHNSSLEIFSKVLMKNLFFFYVYLPLFLLAGWIVLFLQSTTNNGLIFLLDYFFPSFFMFNHPLIFITIIILISVGLIFLPEKYHLKIQKMMDSFEHRRRWKM
jgi:hypothetical protein